MQSRILTTRFFKCSFFVLISVLAFTNVFGQNCPAYSSTVTSPAVTCGNQPYYFQVANTGCNGTISFTVSGNYGSLYASEITWTVTSNLTGAVVASGGPGANNGNINVTVGPFNPATVGTIYTLTINDSFGDGFNGTGGTIGVYQNGSPIAGPITGNFGATSTTIFGANITISPVTVTVNTPSGPVTSTVSNCNNVNMPLTLQNNNYCSPITVALPWTITCNSTGAVLASGTHTITVYPKIPTNASDVVSISWNNSTCSWNVSPQNGCTTLDIGTIFSISPNPATFTPPACGGGSQTFQVTYNGIAAGPNCCSTGGPLVPITYNFTDNTPTSISSPFGGTNNSAVLTIPASNTGGNATSVTLNVNMSGFCFNQPGANTPVASSYWVTIYHNNTIILDQQSANPGPANYSTTLNLAAIPGFNQNSVITVYIYPNSFNASGVNTTYSPTANCATLADGFWTAGSITATLSATYLNQTTSPATCLYTTSQSFTCCNPTAVTNQSQTICTGQTFASLSSWQTTVNGSNPCVVYSSITPIAGSVAPNNQFPNGINTGTSPIIQTVNAYAYCDANGSGTINAGDTYTLISSFNLTVNPAIAPTFTQIAPICSGGSFTLPITSTNSIAGTWSPAVNNTVTTTYTFTPAAGACATTTTMTVNVNSNTTPTFTQVAAICSGGSIALPTTSNNAITGAWSPAVNNTATTTYTFTPTAGQCATTATMSVTVNQPAVPTFTQVAAICSGGTFTLPTTSNNAITGTWSPAVNNTATTTYTFTPTVGQCATTATMSVTVNQPTVPTFTQLPQICSGGTISFPTTSNNAISGTWSPALNNTATTTYTFTPTAGQCATTATMTVNVGPPVTPTFTQIAPICSGGSFTLPTTSTNSIAGTWSPAVNNTATTTYTFTPAVGACATTTTMSVTVNPNITPTFTQVAPICSGGSFTLPTTSDNAISGTWSPAVNNTATTTYTFTPTAGQCATTATMSVTVNQPTVPTFTQVAAICSGGTFTLPTTSNNAITGTWSPAVNNTATTTYTFTPTAGQCATTATMTVIVDQPVTPTFPSAGPFCLNDVLPQVMLPTTSLNGINGTWNPGMLSTATAGTFTYTFTPNAGECAVSYSTTVTVNDPVTPAFNQIAPLCSGANFTLPATSTNSIAGSWSPAVNNTATTTYTFTPAAGTCATTATMTVVIGAQLTPTFVPDVTTGCVPLTVNFNNTSANSVSCSWNFGNGTTLAGCGPVSATFNSPGCYDITLTITDANGCSGTLTANNLICVEDAPDVAFTPSTGVISQLNTTVNFNNNTTGAVSYDWDFGDGFGSTVFEPTHTYPDEPNGYTVTLVATSAAGCVDSASAVIQYYEELIYYIPNTFTPDDDMYNQTFKPVFTSGFDPYDYNLFIYNRWGELIFESHDPAFGWDGTYGTAADNRKVQDGTYTWKIEFKTLQSDERKRVTGHVILIR